jgi:menaquinone-specific isochorismate synthase
MSERYIIITPTEAPLPVEQAVESLASALAGYERDYASAQTLQPGSIVEFSQKINPLDIKSWLGSQEVYPRLFWMNREKNYAAAGIGSADTIQFEGNGDNESSFSEFGRLMSQKHPEARYFGGFRFNNLDMRESIWKEFSSCFLILPLVQLTFEGNEYRLSCRLVINGDGGTTAGKISELRQTLDQIRPDTGFASQKLPEVVKLSYNPDEKNWESICRKALGTFESGDMEKIALARQTVLEFSGSFSPFLFMLRYPSRNSAIYNFYFEPSRNNAFLSFSPERLYSRNGRMLLTEALAGTCSKETQNGDHFDASEVLLNSEKDIREHKFVKDMIYNELLEVSSDIDMEEDVQVLRLNHLAHLYTRCSARLKPEFENDSAVLKTLHPTPAVGGVPRDHAMQRIMELEPFSRGWYAAPAGWISRDAAEFSVAIRSALVSGNHAYLYSGAGLVKGSDPLSEWEEVAQKIGDLLAITRQEQ